MMGPPLPTPTPIPAAPEARVPPAPALKDPLGNRGRRDTAQAFGEVFLKSFPILLFFFLFTFNILGC